MLQLAEHRVLVTGGRGAIGTVVCDRLAALGASVVVNDVLPDTPGGAEHVVADGSTSAGAADLVDRAWARGPLTDVVLLAGVARSGGLLDQTQEDVEEVLRVNVVAATLTAQAAVARWVEHGLPGNLVFVGSWVQDVPWPGIAPYAASKAALRSMARSFAREFATHGIRANVMAPGIVAVGMAHHQWETEPDYRARASRAVPLGRLQPPGSVADAVAFLCSDLATYMTGATLLVDGGASLYPLDPDEVPPA